MDSTIRMLVALPLLLMAGEPSHAARAAQPGAPRVIEISAERFQFWPAEVVVREGEEVELRLRSDDTIHGFRILGSGTNLQIPKRGHGYAMTRFTGNRPGRYTFECNRLCGAGHDFMRGVIVVRPAGTGVVP
ncbi:MAG TPA: cupredoxin domain-containing protein [Vicinamibacterales bacterium]|jgi:heme/copper-type cytochrome/quinol oxidase subunit 2